MALTTRAAPRAAQVQGHTERVLQIATCMAMAGFGEAVARMAGMARAFYWDKVLWAVHKGHKGAQRGRTYLMYAAETGNLARLRFLLARGAAVDEGNKWGSTALVCASFTGHLEAVRCLVEHGADVNAAMKDDGFTALMWASQEGHLEIVRFLVEHGGVNLDRKSGV